MLCETCAEGSAFTEEVVGNLHWFHALGSLFRAVNPDWNPRPRWLLFNADETTLGYWGVPRQTQRAVARYLGVDPVREPSLAAYVVFLHYFGNDETFFEEN